MAEHPEAAGPGSDGGQVPARAKRARKDGDPFASLSGYPWQEWVVTMTDGTARRTAVPASGEGAGPRAARHNAEEGPCRDASDTPIKETSARSRSEGYGQPLDAVRLKAWAALGFPDGPPGRGTRPTRLQPGGARPGRSR